MYVAVCPTSSAPPPGLNDAQPGTVIRLASLLTGRGAGAVKLGSSFTGVTMTVNVRVTVSTPPLAVPPLSFTVTVITAVPDWFATGVYESEAVAAGLV